MPFSRFAGALLLPPLIAAAWLSIHRAYADAEFRRGTPQSVQHALALEPSNAEYTLLRALQIEYDGADPTALLLRAAGLNPMNATPLIRLALAAEIRGDFPGAEQSLLAAASVNRQFEPRWTLANFYFRRGNQEQFWKWMRAALDVSYGDRRPAFELCWNTTGDPAEILTRAIPNRRDALQPYLQYLNETNRVAAIPAVALKLTPGDGEDRPLILTSVDALIAADHAAAAKQLWRALGYSDPSNVFHGDFEPPEIGAGFDWHFTPAPGLTHLAIDQPQRMHRIIFNGAEPVSSELLRQELSLQPHTHYTLRWQARTQGIASPTGIAWRIGDQQSPIAANENATAGEFRFIAPADLAPLILMYSRPTGETRAEGSIELWRVSITRD